jgi:hypothetical protein
MTAMMMVSFAASSVIFWASGANRGPTAVTHNMAHSFDVVDAAPREDG